MKPEQIKTTLQNWIQNRKHENKEKQRRRKETGNKAKGAIKKSKYEEREREIPIAHLIQSRIQEKEGRFNTKKFC